MYKWHSIHIYFNGNWIDFIKNDFSKILSFAEEEFELIKFFYIRYFDEAHHVRFRVLLKSNQKNFYLRLNKFIYGIDYKSILYNTHEKIHKNTNEFINILKIKSVDYEPEFVRYGGKEAIKIAESQFCSSSRSILQIIISSLNSNYSTQIGIAVRMHLGFSVGLGLSIKEIRQLFSLFQNLWLEKTRELISLNSNNKKISRALLVEKFEQKYLLSKDVLLKNFKEIYYNKEYGNDEDASSFCNWVNDMSSVKSMLVDLEKQKKIEFPENIPLHFTNAKPLTGECRYWTLYVSYIHMTNNRLGINNIDEAFIAYIICRCCDDISY